MHTSDLQVSTTKTILRRIFRYNCNFTTETCFRYRFNKLQVYIKNPLIVSKFDDKINLLYFLVTMTKYNFNNLPDEVLSIIFQGLVHHDLHECQLVCRAWYNPAHRLYMKNIKLRDNLSVERFVNYIKNNPSHADTVQQIKVLVDHGTTIVNTLTDIEHLGQLFSIRYSNARVLKLFGSETIKNSSLYESIFKSCPSLEKMKFTSLKDTPFHQCLIRGYQQSLTNLLINKKTSEWLSSEFLTSFPQLRDLIIPYHQNYRNCESWLRLFHQKFTLKSLKITLEDADEKGFVERYIQSRTVEEQNQIIEKLSKLETLYINDKVCNVNSIQFMAQYFTGLNHLEYNNWASILNDQANIQTTYKKILDLASRLPSCAIDFPNYRGLPQLSQWIPIFCQVFYNQLPPHSKCLERKLTLRLESVSSTLRARMKTEMIRRHQLKRKVTIEINRSDPVTLQLVKESVTMHDINYFKFFFNSSFYGSRYLDFITMFQEVLSALPTVTKVLLLMPGNRLGYPEKPTGKQYPQVTHLELEAEDEVNRVFMWKGCTRMFPGIKHLKLKYFSGMYREKLKEYQIFLPGIRLERLHLDISPLFMKTKELPRRIDEAFFVLDIETERIHRLYKVTLKELGVYQLDKEDIENLAKDYLRIHISVVEIQLITMYLFREAIAPYHHTHNERSRYLDLCLERVAEVVLHIH